MCQVTAYRMAIGSLSPFEYFGIPISFTLGWLFSDSVGDLSRHNLHHPRRFGHHLSRTAEQTAGMVQAS